MSDHELDFVDMFGNKANHPIESCTTVKTKSDNGNVSSRYIQQFENDFGKDDQKCEVDDGSNQSISSSSSDDYHDMFGDSSSSDSESKGAQNKACNPSLPPSNIRVPRKQIRKQNDLTVDTLKRKRDTTITMHANSQIISYKPFSADDYWKSFRSWDFVSELNESIKRNNSHNKSQKSTNPDDEAGGIPSRGKWTGDSDDSRHVAQSPRDPEDALPDDFTTVDQYIALWAPLQLKETRAQILSDVISNHTVSFQKISIPIHVKPKKASDPYSESMILTISLRSEDLNVGSVRGQSNGQALEFLQNDLVLVTCDASIAEQAYKGTLRPTETQSSYSMSTLLSMASPFASGRLAIVGVVCNRNKGVDGLEVTVKRSLWKDTSHSGRDLYLMKMGKNVTAFREFKALCSMKEMPLSKYILSPKHKVESPPHKKSLNTSAKDPLSESGGSNTLGIGFRIWVKSKFNPSQQAAISAAAREYGDGGFTLVQGPPGSGKSTTLVAILNALHLRQYQKYFSSIERITLSAKTSNSTEVLAAIKAAGDVKPRILVCAPSNAAVDNVILKIMENRFYDGNGCQYSPSIIRIGSGQSPDVASVALDQKVNKIISLGSNPEQLDKIIVDTRKELKRLHNEIENLQIRVRLIANSTTYALSRDWEIRVDEGNFEMNKRVIYVNHKTKKVQLTCPPKPIDGEELYPTDQMPHYRSCMSSLVKYIERHSDLHFKLLQYIQIQNTASSINNSNRARLTAELNQNIETNVLDSTHIVMTTLGSSGSKTLDNASKFSVIVIDEAAQCSEPAMLPALKLGSSHCVLVGDPQQLPATIFSMSGRETKYDRSLFQRLQDAGHHVYMLNIQYRMHPQISDFPRRIFYAGSLKDGPNVCKPNYGEELNKAIRGNFRHFQPFTILDVESKEEKDGTSLSNKTEANLALHLFSTLRDTAQIKTKIAILTPYQQQVGLLKRIFQEKYGLSYTKLVDISTVDSFQGKESPIVILSCVRASPAGGGIGFLSDVQRMNVALTRAKHFLFVIAKCQSIIVNPYWKDLVAHALEKGSILKVLPKAPATTLPAGRSSHALSFPDLRHLQPVLLPKT